MRKYERSDVIKQDLIGSLKIFVIGILLLIFPFILEGILNIFGYIGLALDMLIFPLIGIFFMVLGVAGLLSNSLIIITKREGLSGILMTICVIVSIVLVLTFAYYVIIGFLSLYYT